MIRKRKLFVGCSKNERTLALEAKVLLSQDFDVTIWDDTFWETNTQAFKLNDNILQGLLRASLQFDFALMIGTRDDEVVKKGKVVLQARDNVLFELGLFIGRMGLGNCSFIVDQQLNILEDLKGIVLSKFEVGNENSFQIAVEKIRKYFYQKNNWSVNYFPSATLAASYFDSLILPTYNYLIQTNGLEYQGKKYANWKFQVVIPKSLSEDVNVQLQSSKSGRNLKDLEINTPGRPRKITLETDFESDIPIIVDFPTALSGINHAIKHLLPHEYNERNKDYQEILERELERFKWALLDYAKRRGNDLFERITFELIE